MTTSSNEKVNATRPATTIAGIISGSVTRRKTRQRRGAEVGGRLLEVVGWSPARLDDHRCVGGVEDDVADHDRPDAEATSLPAKQDEQAERGTDLGQHDPHVRRRVQRRAAARDARRAQSAAVTAIATEIAVDSTAMTKLLRKSWRTRGLSIASANQWVVNPPQWVRISSPLNAFTITSTIGAYRNTSTSTATAEARGAPRHTARLLDGRRATCAPSTSDDRHAGHQRNREGRPEREVAGVEELTGDMLPNISVLPPPRISGSRTRRSPGSRPGCSRRRCRASRAGSRPGA